MSMRHVAIAMLLLLACAGCGKNSAELAQLAESSMQKRDYATAVQLFEKATERARTTEERDKLQSLGTHAQELKESEESYKSGIGYFQGKNYRSAYVDLSKVASGSEHYDDAQDKKRLSAKYASENAISEAKRTYRGGEIAAAIGILKDAKQYGNPAVTTVLEQYKKEYTSILLRKAQNLYAAGNYGEALARLREARDIGSSEASRLLPMYEAKQARAEEQARLRQARAEEQERLRQERRDRQREKEEAKYYEGDGAVRIAVNGVELHRSTELHTANRDSTFVYVYISAKNTGDSIVHVNPNDFTLADSNGSAVSHESDTYSLSNYLDAVDLRPGQRTGGWLVFIMLKDNKYTLGYQGFGGTAEKAVIP